MKRLGSLSSFVRVCIKEFVLTLGLQDKSTIFLTAKVPFRM